MSHVRERRIRSVAIAQCTAYTTQCWRREKNINYNCWLSCHRYRRVTFSHDTLVAQIRTHTQTHTRTNAEMKKWREKKKYCQTISIIIIIICCLPLLLAVGWFAKYAPVLRLRSHSIKCKRGGEEEKKKRCSGVTAFMIFFFRCIRKWRLTTNKCRCGSDTCCAVHYVLDLFRVDDDWLRTKQTKMTTFQREFIYCFDLSFFFRLSNEPIVR